jgi:hypothetical protein
MLKEDFLKDVQNWDNHRHLLWEAMELTTGEVVEMGIGQGSTPFLHQYCKDANRRLFSYENNLEWYNKFTDLTSDFHTLTWTINWDIVNEKHSRPAVVFIDHAPGERRYIDVGLFANKADIIVIHDSEPAATGYMMDKIWHLFKYRKDFKSEGAWATMVSNTIKF